MPNLRSNCCADLDGVRAFAARCATESRSAPRPCSAPGPLAASRSRGRSLAGWSLMRKMRDIGNGLTAKYAKHTKKINRTLRRVNNPKVV